jgi:hypothetical protein
MPKNREVNAIMDPVLNLLTGWSAVSWANPEDSQL